MNEVKRKACSRKIFAARISTYVFTEKERKKSDCRGIKIESNYVDTNRLNLIHKHFHHSQTYQRRMTGAEPMLRQLMRKIVEKTVLFKYSTHIIQTSPVFHILYYSTQTQLFSDQVKQTDPARNAGEKPHKRTHTTTRPILKGEGLIPPRMEEYGSGTI